MPLVELTWAIDRFSLYNRLDSENRDESLPVRHTIWYICTGKIERGNVFVDDWPEFKHAACLHSTRLYDSSSGDRDFLVMATTDLTTFGGFVDELSRHQRWQQRDGVILAYVEERAAEMIVGILRSTDEKASHDGSTVWLSKPLPHYTGYYRENFDRYARLFEQFRSRFPADLTISTLKPDEAPMVAEQWPYDLPDKTAMIRWWIARFPSVCTRDADGRPVAWTLSYSFGATGAAYVRPEYRGRGIHEVQVSHLLVELFRINPGLRYFWILDDNVVSLRQAQRSTLDMRQTELKMRLGAYTPAKIGKAHL